MFVGYVEQPVEREVRPQQVGQWDEEQSKILEVIQQNSRNRAPNRSKREGPKEGCRNIQMGKREEQMGKKVLALGTFL